MTFVLITRFIFNELSLDSHVGNQTRIIPAFEVPRLQLVFKCKSQQPALSPCVMYQLLFSHFRLYTAIKDIIVIVIEVVSTDLAT